MARYSKEYKESLVCKVLNHPERSIRLVAREEKISVSTLHSWVQRAKDGGKGALSGAGRSKEQQEWTSSQKLQALLDTAALVGDNLNQYCREQGLYKQQLDQWRQQFMKQPDRTEQQQQANAIKELRQKNKELQKELRRKEKALAEASALLVMKKKADLIWPDHEDD